jgi:hypothetical protein
MNDAAPRRPPSSAAIARPGGIQRSTPSLPASASSLRVSA